MKTRKPWMHYFPLIWLVFLSLPILGMLNQKRTSLEYLYGFSLIVIFVFVFLWSFFWVRNQDELNLERPYRLPSVVGTISSYTIMALFWSLLEGDSLGFLCDTHSDP